MSTRVAEVEEAVVREKAMVATLIAEICELIRETYKKQVELVLAQERIEMLKQMEK